MFLSVKWQSLACDMKKKTDQLFVSDILNFPMVAGPPKGGRVEGMLDDEEA